MFAQHGKSVINDVNHTLEIQLTGPFNLEFFDGLHATLNRYPCQNTPFILLMLSGEALMDKQSINSHITFWQQYHVNAVAICLESCASAIVTQCVFEHIFEEAMVYHRFFKQNTEARAWLRESHLEV